MGSWGMVFLAEELGFVAGFGFDSLGCFSLRCFGGVFGSVPCFAERGV